MWIAHGGGEVDTFLINKITGIDEKEIERLSTDMNSISAEKAISLMDYVEREINRIVHEYKASQV